MPLYEYECTACGNRFEKIRKFSDPPLEACPKCDGAVRKLLSSPAIQFKGTGWYITDYAKKSGTGAGSDKSEKGDSADKSGDSGKKDGSASAPAASADKSAAAPASSGSSSTPAKSE